MHPAPVAFSLLMAASLTHDMVTGAVAVTVGLMAAWFGSRETPEGDPAA